MYNFEILEIEQYAAKELQGFEKLQLPYLKSSPHPTDLLAPQNRKLLTVRVTFGQEPVALLLAKMFYQKKIGEIISLFVDPKYRKQKIATQMIDLLKQKTLEYGIKLLGIVYPTTLSESPQIEEFLHKNGFTQKQFIMAEFQFDYTQFHPPWFEKNYRWPHDFDIFSWTDLRYEDIAKINKKYSNGAIPYDVYPFIQPGSFEPCNSLGLRYKGEVIAWVVNERILPEMINYKNIYVDYEFQHSGVAIYLLVESLKIHAQKQIKWGIFQINLLNCSASWLHFIRRRLAPYASHIYEYSSQSLFILNDK